MLAGEARPTHRQRAVPLAHHMGMGAVLVDAASTQEPRNRGLGVCARNSVLSSCGATSARHARGTILRE